MSASDAAPVPAAPDDERHGVLGVLSCHEGCVTECSAPPELPEGAEWFPAEGGIQWQGKTYYPADYILTREDIRAIRDAALTEAADAAAKVLDNASRIGSGTLRSTAIAMIPAAIRSLQEGNTHD